MELEELKSKWFEVDRQLENQKVLTSEMILKMAGYRSNLIFNPIITFEKSGMAISLVILIYIFSNFGKLNDWLSLAGAVTTIFILIVSLVMSVILIKRIQEVDIVKNDYKETLLHVNRIKKFHYSVKWVSAFLTPVLAVSILPTLASTWFDKSLLYDLEEYWESLFPSLLLIPVIWYFIGRFYAKKLNDINELLMDFEK
jgi:hypothetical protein